MLILDDVLDDVGVVSRRAMEIVLYERHVRRFVENPNAHNGGPISTRFVVHKASVDDTESPCVEDCSSGECFISSGCNTTQHAKAGVKNLTQIQFVCHTG